MTMRTRVSLKPRSSRLSIALCPDKEGSELPISSTDQSDEEWAVLQARASAEKQIVALSERQIEAVLSELPEDPLNPDDLINSLSEKEEEVVRLTNTLHDLEARMLWDLSFALKLQLFAESGKNLRRAEAIGCVDIHEIMTNFTLDPLSPQRWISDIKAELLSRAESG
jgi:hypothetical protein